MINLPLNPISHGLSGIYNPQMIPQNQYTGMGNIVFPNSIGDLNAINQMQQQSMNLDLTNRLRGGIGFNNNNQQNIPNNQQNIPNNQPMNNMGNNQMNQMSFLESKFFIK